MKYLIISICFVFVPYARTAQDELHVNCGNGELKVSGPVATVHSECSAGLDPVSEKNLCEMQCIMKREGLFDEKGLPSLDKNMKYLEKIMTGEILEKGKALSKICFEKHLAELKPVDEDKNCEVSKNFNSCMKTRFMSICS